MTLLPDSLASLGLDPGLLAIRDSGGLLDPVFLDALARELEERVGPAESAELLRQIGFVHGYRDALRALEGDLMVTALPILMRTGPSERPAGGVEARGSWPERAEASARLARRGHARACGCHLSAGYTSGWLSGHLDGDLLALETECAATGACECLFEAREASAWRGDPRAEAVLAALPFEALRLAVLARSEPEPVAPEAEPPVGLDREEAVVHIWGPVMVLPFAGEEQALQALGLIASDPSARDVSVVVVDLAGAEVDEACAAAALERIVDGAEAWGAETLLADASAPTRKALDGLAKPPLLVLEDLDEAIAAAFQVARAQRTSA